MKMEMVPLSDVFLTLISEKRELFECVRLGCLWREILKRKFGHNFSAARTTIGYSYSFCGTSEDREARFGSIGFTEVIAVGSGVVGDHCCALAIVECCCSMLGGESDKMVILRDLPDCSSEGGAECIPCIAAALE